MGRKAVPERSRVRAGGEPYRAKAAVDTVANPLERRSRLRWRPVWGATAIRTATRCQSRGLTWSGTCGSVR
ncbi:hypothetical protein IW256_007265 [Actinomadura viridis]|uniref:Uncharacterized protein n=1 Tax=Actinomadura viridis TaxID=58110 RepID=A0A931GMX9_9ACTN|nr:hypothetical protein [Actinomadura viridis]